MTDEEKRQHLAALNAERTRVAARKRVAESLWRRAELDWKLQEHQVGVYQKIKDAAKLPNSRFVLNASRRWGKTFLLCCIAIEYALTHPRAAILYCASSQKQVREMVYPALNEILIDCPEDLRPKIKTQNHQVVFANGAWIKITGLDGGRLTKLRGITAHMVIVDEAGFIDDLSSAVQATLFPMTSSTGGQMILSSNAPLTPGHDFVKVFTRQAEAAGLYCKQTIYDVKKYTKEDIDRFAESCGGYDSSTFLREYMGKFCVDESNAVLPEWTKMEDKLVRSDIVRPEFFFPIVAIDLGIVDFTGALFGYYHFGMAAIVIEDELLLKGTNSEKLVKACRDKEEQLWTADVYKKPIRIADGSLFTIGDINSVHRYAVGTPSKGNSLEAQVNKVREDIQNMRLFVHPRCVNLIGQMQDGTWNRTRTEYKRDSMNGHFDLLAALQYLVKHANRSSNPSPPLHGLDRMNTVIKDSRLNNPSLSKLQKLFGSKA